MEVVDELGGGGEEHAAIAGVHGCPAVMVGEEGEGEIGSDEGERVRGRGRRVGEEAAEGDAGGRSAGEVLQGQARETEGIPGATDLR